MTMLPKDIDVRSGESDWKKTLSERTHGIPIVTVGVSAEKNTKQSRFQMCHVSSDREKNKRADWDGRLLSHSIPGLAGVAALAAQM